MLQNYPDEWLSTYDAWNRLVKVEIDPDGPAQGVGPVLRATYEYNGLHQRTVRTADASSNGAIDTQNLYYYDSSWRLCEERTDDSYNGSTFTLEKIVQRIWDPLYIDALIAMQTDLLDSSRPPMSPPDGDFTNANILYSIADRKYDVIAMMTSSAAIPEWVRYSAYGVARHLPLGDANHDGMVNGSDQGALLVNWGQTLGAAGSFYNPDFDLNRDGTIDGADQGILLVNWKAAAEPEGILSTIGNTVGYSGYIYDNATNLSLARFRWYDATEGRWVTRDPDAYVDSHNLYEYINSTPVNSTDPYGLIDPGWARPNRPNPFWPDGGSCGENPLKDLYEEFFSPTQRANISCGAKLLSCIAQDTIGSAAYATVVYGSCAVRYGRNVNKLLACFARRSRHLFLNTGLLGVADCMAGGVKCYDGIYDFLPTNQDLIDRLPKTPLIMPPGDHPWPYRGRP